MSYTINIQESSEGDLYFELPPEIIRSLGWTEDDELEFVVHGQDSFMLRKIKPTENN